MIAVCLTSTSCISLNGGCYANTNRCRCLLCRSGYSSLVATSIVCLNCYYLNFGECWGEEDCALLQLRSYRWSSSPQLPEIANLGNSCNLWITKDANLRGLVNHVIHDFSFLQELQTRKIGQSQISESWNLGNSRNHRQCFQQIPETRKAWQVWDRQPQRLRSGFHSDMRKGKSL